MNKNPGGGRARDRLRAHGPGTLPAHAVERGHGPARPPHHYLHTLRGEHKQPQACTSRQCAAYCLVDTHSHDVTSAAAGFACGYSFACAPLHPAGARHGIRPAIDHHGTPAAKSRHAPHLPFARVGYRPCDGPGGGHLRLLPDAGLSSPKTLSRLDPCGAHS